jgi:hypothetical protein
VKKACESCKWLGNRNANSSFYKCDAPQNTMKNGDRRWTYCAVQRMSAWPYNFLLGSCGKGGRWFKQREPDMRNVTPTKLKVVK